MPRCVATPPPTVFAPAPVVVAPACPPPFRHGVASAPAHCPSSPSFAADRWRAWAVAGAAVRHTADQSARVAGPETVRRPWPRRHVHESVHVRRRQRVGGRAQLEERVRVRGRTPPLPATATAPCADGPARTWRRTRHAGPASTRALNSEEDATVTPPSDLDTSVGTASPAVEAPSRSETSTPADGAGKKKLNAEQFEKRVTSTLMEYLSVRDKSVRPGPPRAVARPQRRA